jgi:transcriptional regulator with XRE-family HTH domain
MTQQGSPRPAKVTPEHLEEARRLKLLWTQRNELTQEKFGEEFEIGTQGAVWRFLNGKDPLSLKAAKGFAVGLKCNIADFSPRLAQEAQDYARFAPEERRSLTQLQDVEAQLILMFRGLHTTGQNELLNTAARLYGEAHPAEAASPGWTELQPKVASRTERRTRSGR